MKDFSDERVSPNRTAKGLTFVSTSILITPFLSRQRPDYLSFKKKLLPYLHDTRPPYFVNLFIFKQTLPYLKQKIRLLADFITSKHHKLENICAKSQYLTYPKLYPI